MTKNAAAFRQFELEVNEFLEGVVPEEVRRVRSAIALQALRGVVLKTPVDEGRARGNWQVGAGVIPSGAIARVDKTGGQTISAGFAAISAFQDPYGAIYVTNNLPYILRLEDGSSRQAPAGMVSVTLAELEVQFP